MGKKEKKEKKPTACEAYIERIKVLEKDIEAYRKDGDELGDEILRLRRSVASYKSANTTFKNTNAMLKKKVDELTKKASHNREVDVEGDHLYEDAIAEIEKMKKTEQGLRDQVAKLTERIRELDKQNESLNQELEKEKSTPWYKKIF